MLAEFPHGLLVEKLAAKLELRHSRPKSVLKLPAAGVRESGVVAFTLSWVGKGAGASAAAAVAADGAIPGLHWSVGGIDEPGGRVTQCSFCGEMRRTEPKGWLAPGVAGASVFICTRCLIFAERMLHSGVERLFHLTKTTSQTCSFCQTEHVPECVTVRRPTCAERAWI
jgi:hypothetical protein